MSSHKLGMAASVIALAFVALLMWPSVSRADSTSQSNSTASTDVLKDGNKLNENYEIATFAGGCFWCMQPAFDIVPGVVSTIVGYSGGQEKDPSYKDVAYGKTGHAESILVTYDPSKVGFEKLLEVFWHTIDPTQANGQFADRGPQYRTAIFYHNDEQRRLAEKSKEALAKSGKFSKPIVTEISPATEFYTAEEFHQGYYKKNAVHYKLYSVGSGRAGFIEKTWGKK